MGYRLLITRRAEDLLDNLVGYLLLELGNKPAAVRLLDGVEKIYCRLEQNPFQFPVSYDRYLSGKGYREALVPGIVYRVIFRVTGESVAVLGIFHQLESFRGRVQ